MTLLMRALVRLKVLSPSKDMKSREEVSYWAGRYKAEGGKLSNTHYKPLYTTVFGLTDTDYDGKRVLDIGCGPRGSLEWASQTLQRVGLDPLVPEYLKLGADKHAMEYAAAPSEAIPFPDGHFDIVTCLNALDHVDNLDRTINEIKRVTKSGGLFLLSTEINHRPTPTEPITLTEATFRQFEPEFSIVLSKKHATPRDHDLHKAVREAKPDYVEGKPGIYVAKMLRR